MNIPWYHLHPIVVHFPIALLVTSLGIEVLALLRKGPEWLTPAAKWLLWMGTIGAALAVSSGLLAEKTAPHVPAAWKTLAHHKTLGYWTAGVFAALSLWK